MKERKYSNLPEHLPKGQLAFNRASKEMFVGDGEDKELMKVTDSILKNANVDYMGNEHENVRDTQDANIEYVLGEVSTVHYEGQHITATDTIARQVKQAELRGQTLVNVHQQTLGRYTLNCTRQYDQYNVEVAKNPMMSIGKTYLYILDVIENTANSTATWINSHNTLTNEWYMIQAGKTGRMVFKANFKENANNPWRYNWFEFNEKLDNYTGHIVFTLAIIPYQDGMENWDIPYFEGMKSVQMPVLTTCGENLIGLVTTWEKIEIDCNTGVETPKPNGTRLTSNLIRNPIKNRLYVRSIGEWWNYIYYYDINKNYLGYETNQGMLDTFQLLNSYTPTGNEYYVRVSFGTEVGKDKAELYTNDIGHASYEPPQSHTLTTPSDLTLRGIDNVCDTVDLITDKKVERIEEIVLDGSEYWRQIPWNGLTKPIYRLILDIHSDIRFNTNYIRCNMFPIGCGAWTDSEHIWIDNYNTLTIHTNRFNSLEEFKSYISNSNLIVQYTVSESIKSTDLMGQKVYSYEGKTHYTCSSAEGSLVPTLSINVPTNTPSMIARQRDLISTLTAENSKLKQEILKTNEERESNDLELLSNDFDMDFRIMNIELNLDVPNLLGSNSSRLRSPYDMAKSLILCGKYDYEDMTYKLDVYLNYQKITQEEYDELISLMNQEVLF